MKVWLLLFQFESPWYPYVVFIPIARTSSTILKRYGESGQPCRVPDFSEMALSFSPLNLMLAVGLLYIAFIIFRYDPHKPNLSNTLILNGCWILSNAVSASNEMIIWIFSFSLFIWWITLIDLRKVEPNLHLWDEAHLITMDNFSTVFLDSVCQYFSVNVHEWDWSVILFLGCVFVWFWYQSNRCFIKRVWQWFFCFYIV